MALDQSAVLELLEALKAAEVDDRIRAATEMALVLSVSGGGASASTVLLTGLADLLAGRCRWQPESTSRALATRAAHRVGAGTRHPRRGAALDVDATEPALVYRARG